jgi:hypothetical protein
MEVNRLQQVWLTAILVVGSAWMGDHYGINISYCLTWLDNHWHVGSTIMSTLDQSQFVEVYYIPT